MGKVTLYHPVSLYVIRGAALHGGFTLGRITQTRVSLAEGWAEYRATVLQAYPKFWDLPQAFQRAAIDGCFALDISCTWAGYNTRHEFMVNLRTQIVPNEDATDAAVEGVDYVSG
jgi:hypothetical protein